VEYYADEDELTPEWVAREITPGPTMFAEWAIKGGIDGHTQRQIEAQAPTGHHDRYRKEIAHPLFTIEKDLVRINAP
jgi:hypothetical protein